MYIPISMSLGRAPKIPRGRHVLQGGVTIYVKDGQKHRENGPAEINTRTGYKAWFWKGKRHRVGGPTVINPLTNSEEYWKHGKKIKPPTKDRILWMKKTRISGLYSRMPVDTRYSFW